MKPQICVMTKYRFKTLCLSVALFAMAEAPSFSQEQMTPDDSKAFRSAIKMADKCDNRGAIGILRGLYDKYPENLSVAYNLGVCYINASGNPDSTLFFLNRGNELDDNETWDDARIELNLAMARAKQLCGKPKEAIAIYDEIEKVDTLKAYTDMIKRERMICESAIVLMNQPVHLVMRYAGDAVNSSNNDYKPVLTANEDSMFFTSRRPKKDADKTIIFDDGQSEEGVYLSVRQGNKWDGGNWGPATQISGLVVDESGKAGQETATSISADGTEMYLSHNGDIYVSRKDTATGKWQPATPLPEPVNSVYNEDFAFITHDGQELFISSDCPGGFGGKDIYRSRRLPNGLWGELLNLGPGVNTEEDEDAPFFHAQTGILYFSSRGHNTMGGYDIFYAPESDKGEFKVSTNIGFPINSPDDDLYFSPSIDRDRAYYASIRWNDNSKAPSYDLYEVEYDQPEQNRMAVIAALVKAPNLEDVTVVTIHDGDIIGIGHPNVHSGNFVTIVEAGGTYDLVAYCGSDSLFAHVATLKSQSYYASQSTVNIAPFVFEGGDAMGCARRPSDNLTYRHAASLSDRPDDDRPYTVQLMSLRRPLDFSLLGRGLEPDSVLEYKYRDGWYVYSYGSFRSYRDAFKAQKKIRRSTRYSDAFARNAKQYDKFVKPSGGDDAGRGSLRRADKL